MKLLCMLFRYKVQKPLLGLIVGVHYVNVFFGMQNDPIVLCHLQCYKVKTYGGIYNLKIEWIIGRH
jgi:hypothetical protein